MIRASQQSQGAEDVNEDEETKDGQGEEEDE
jgi:hypothetical protein